MSDISKVQASKEKCRRHRDNWKREALRLRSIIEGLCEKIDSLPRQYPNRIDVEMAISNIKTESTRAKAELNKTGEGVDSEEVGEIAELKWTENDTYPSMLSDVVMTLNDVIRAVKADRERIAKLESKAKEGK